MINCAGMSMAGSRTTSSRSGDTRRNGIFVSILICTASGRRFGSRPARGVARFLPLHTALEARFRRATPHPLGLRSLEWRDRAEKPPGSWMPEQVVDFMVAAMAAGDFYIICPDNDVTRDIDNRRILWIA